MNSSYKSLLNFWGLQIGQSICADKLYIEKATFVEGGKVFKFYLSEKLRPEWLSKGESPNIYCRSIYRDRSLKGEILAAFSNGSERFPAIVRQEDGRIIYNFDIQETIDFLINEKYSARPRPLYTYFPVPVQALIPRRLRKVIKSYSMLLQRGRKNRNNFPQWPIEMTVELLRNVFLNSLKLLYNGQTKPKPFWPNSKKYALLLTHDVDSKEGLSHIKKIADIEENYNFTSTWFIPGNDYKIDYNILDKITANGHQIGLHGAKHDNRIAFLPRDEIRKRLNGCLSFIKRYQIKGFRSPSLFRSKQLFDILSDYFLYDSSVPDVAKLSPTPSVNGACTVFPYTIGNLVELPITVPLDSSLIFLGYGQDRIIELWKKKIKWIKQVGGLAVIVTHPEPHFIANPLFLQAYEKLLDWISQDSDLWRAHPSEVVEGWLNRQDLSYQEKL